MQSQQETHTNRNMQASSHCLLLSPSSFFAQAENEQFICDMLGHNSKLYLDEFFL